MSVMFRTPAKMSQSERGVEVVKFEAIVEKHHGTLDVES
jgi:hypothetical protein